MSSRRKSSTPCMALPSEALGQDFVHDKREKTIEKRVGDAKEMMKGELEVVPPLEGPGQALVIVSNSPNADESMVSSVKDKKKGIHTLGCTEPKSAGDSSDDQTVQESQSDFSDGGGDPSTVYSISLSKTPIMRTKTKPEPKRIAVSLKSADKIGDSLDGGCEGKLGEEPEPIEAPLEPMTPVEMLLRDSNFGADAFLINLPSEQQTKSSLLYPTVLSAGMTQVFSPFHAQQNATETQPQLLIPLSSIPSYSEAMDTNPLLSSSYRMFPYPPIPEISSLAAQTQFTEEQIKLWFSAQRLKHGVSWTPEEVEEARRKQFNGTVHTVPQTVTVIPAHQLSTAANGLQSILQTCQIVGQPGLMFTQVSGGNLPVTNPITLTLAGLPSQSQNSSKVFRQASSTPSDFKRATIIQPPSLENSALSVDTFSTRPKKSKEQLAELKASYLKNHFASDAEIGRLMKLTNLTKGEIKKWFSDTRYNQRNSKNSHVIVFHDGRDRGSFFGGVSNTAIVIDATNEPPTSPHPPHTSSVKEKEREKQKETRIKTWNPFPDFSLQKFKEKTPEQLVVLDESFEKCNTPSDEELSRLRTETKLTRREIDAWFTERRKMVLMGPFLPHHGAKVETKSEKTEEGEAGDRKSSPMSIPSQKYNQPSAGCRMKHRSTSNKRKIKEKCKKSPEQLHILKSAFARSKWPAPDEYDQLAEETGLSRHYIVSWFGDSRYSWKNGNLKWFSQYQSGNVDGPCSASTKNGGNGNRKRRSRNRGWGRSKIRKQPKRSSSSRADVVPLKKVKTGKEILREYYVKHQFLNEQDLDELVTKTNMSYEQVREWFAEVQQRLDMGSDPFLEFDARERDGEKELQEHEVEMHGERSASREKPTGPGTGVEDDDEQDEEEWGEETDDSEVWEPSRSIKKSLEVSED